MIRKTPPGGYVQLKGGEYLRGAILWFWGLWLILFMDFSLKSPESGWNGLSGLSPSETVWGSVFMAAGTIALVGCAINCLNMRYAGQLLIAISWGWMAAALVSANYQSPSVVPLAGLAVFGIFGLMWVPLVAVCNKARG